MGSRLLHNGNSTLSGATETVNVDTTIVCPTPTCVGHNECGGEIGGIGITRQVGVGAVPKKNLGSVRLSVIKRLA